MFAITVLNPPAAAPITAAELRARLRLNDAAEDTALTEWIAAAVDRFEHDTGRPVLATTYRQDLSRWPSGPIVLGRGGVTAVAAVRRNLDGSVEDLAADQWRADLDTPPARVTLAATPATVTTAAGISISPVGSIEFTAGYENAAAVPKLLRTALMLLAGHWYGNREAYRDSAFEMRETPQGWKAITARYRVGLSGDWGQ